MLPFTYNSCITKCLFIVITFTQHSDQLSTTTTTTNITRYTRGKKYSVETLNKYQNQSDMAGMLELSDQEFL